VAALSIQYRDVKHLLPFLSTVWMYASPVVYPMSRVPERYRLLYALNPWPAPWKRFGRRSLDGQCCGVVGESAVVAIALFVSGAIYFQRTERVFADIV